MFGIPGSVVDTFSNGADPTQPGAIIVSTASVTGKGVSLRINLSDQPSASAASSSLSTQPGAATAANSAAIGAIMSNGEVTGPAMLTDDPTLLNDVAASLGSDSLLNGKKKH